MPSFLQDRGRFGYMDKAVSWGGAVDLIPYLWNHQLLQQQTDTAQLEIHFGGIQLEAQKTMVIALSGHGSDLWINDIQQATWCLHRLKAGDHIHLRANGCGQVSYLAVAKGFSNPGMLRSQSTTVRLDIGPLSGQMLQKGDILSTDIVDERLYQIGLGVPRKHISAINRRKNEAITIQCIEGFDDQNIPTDFRHAFFNHPFVLSSHKDRMGIRFSEDHLFTESLSSDCQHAIAQSIYSEGVIPATIQILPSGIPIVLGPDAQTIGGYPKIGSVFSLDVGLLYQYPAGTPVRFKPISILTAQQKKQAMASQMQEVFRCYHQERKIIQNALYQFRNKFILAITNADANSQSA